MNTKRYLLTTLAVFLFILIYEWVVNGIFLMPWYNATSKTWRELGGAMMLMVPLYQIFLSAWSVFGFTRVYPEGGVKKGIAFGLYVGSFMGVLMASWYLWLPVPGALGLGWLLSGLGEGLGMGVILGAICRKKKLLNWPS